MSYKQGCKLVSLLAAVACGAESANEVTAPATAESADWQATVGRRIEDARYAIHGQGDERFAAANPAQGLRATFDARGVELSGREGLGQRVRVGGTAIARGGEGTPLRPATLALGACRSDGALDAMGECLRRLEGQRGPVTELWENRSDGLEHSFIVHEPVAGKGPLAVWVGVENADVTIEPSGTAARLSDVRSGLSLGYSGLAAWDADGVVLSARMEAREGGLALVVDDANAAYPVMIDPVFAVGTAWTTESNQANARYGWSVASAGDVNGDGFADVIVGAPVFDNGQTNEGRAFVYHGSASGLALAAAWTTESNQADARLGSSVSSAGDVNGDGFGDVIVGVPLYDGGQGNEGRALVYHGSASGLGAAAAWTVESNQVNAQFGSSVAAAGDVNGDDFGDVIAGAFAFDNGQNNEGRAFAYHGSASGLGAAAAWTAESNQASASFGHSVAGAGDVNGDGFGDVIVGATLFDNGQTDEGRAFAYHGSASGLGAAAAWTTESNQAGAQLGFSVSAAGDADADGFGDVWVGAPFYDNGQTNEGAAFLTLGRAAGLAATVDSTLEGNQAEANLGYSVASAADVDGDGSSDVIAGAYQFDSGQTNEGRVIAHQTVEGHSFTFSVDDLFQAINDDLSGEDVDDQRNYRYLSLTNRANVRGTGPGLDRDRDALNKLINSLSIAPTIDVMVDINGEGVVYRIDLRDFEWDRAISVNGQNFDDVWEAIAAHNPYAVRFVGDDADDAVADTGTAYPFMHADSFLATAVVDELYYAVMDIDVGQTLDDYILNELLIDRQQNYVDDELIRAGFSSTSLHMPGRMFLAERHEIQVRAGYMWEISDFGGGLFPLSENPLGFPEGDREMVFSLPNRLLGFAIAEFGGELQNDTILQIDPLQANQRYRIAVSSFAKYAQGFHVVDEVREYALANLGLTPENEAKLLALYPDAADLAAEVASDQENFFRALVDLGLPINAPDPISAVFSKFNADLSIHAVAGDLHLVTAELEDNLDELDPAVQAALASGGKISRSQWTLFYLQSLCIFSVAEENQPDPDLCAEVL